MASWQSKLLSLALRWRMKRLLRPGIDVAAVRARMNRIAGRIPSSVEVEAVSLRNRDGDRLDGEWVRPKHTAPTFSVFYLHGGGYFFCSAATHRSITTALAEKADAEVFALNYRLAPEHPFPAALHDTLDAYRWLLGNGVSPERLSLMGDSAGGGLALSAALSLDDQPGPSSLVLFSPWTDLAATGGSLQDNDRHCAMFNASNIPEAARLYAAPAELNDPRVSPLYAPRFEGLPPTLIFVSDAEVLRDDSIRVADRMREASVSVVLRLEAGLPHVWPLFYPLLPEARQSIDDVTRFALANRG
ncbi:MAG: alpha/beta hydrolase [Pseudomonadota bacterium]